MNVRYHQEDGVQTNRLERLNAVGETNGIGFSGNADADEPGHEIDLNAAAPDMEQSDESDGAETSTTNHYQRLQRAENAWSKLREGVLATTFENQASLFDERCHFCESEAGVCRRLDGGPSVSFCKSCAVSRHTKYNIFHHVEILTVSLLSGLYFVVVSFEK